MSKKVLEPLSYDEALRGLAALAALVTPSTPRPVPSQADVLVKEVRTLSDGACVVEFSISKRAYFKFRPKIRQIRRLLGDDSITDGEILGMAIDHFVKEASSILRAH